jgi:hypothetical protein
MDEIEKPAFLWFQDETQESFFLDMRSEMAYTSGRYMIFGSKKQQA